MHLLLLVSLMFAFSKPTRSLLPPFKLWRSSSVQRIVHPPASKHRIASYNVLSSHLATSDFYPFCNRNHLGASFRFKQITKKVTDEIVKNSIICLQEISQVWEGPLHALFAKSNYYMISGMYGKSNNGYMGVALSIPLDKYHIDDISIIRVGDSIPYSYFDLENWIKKESASSNSVEGLENILGGRIRNLLPPFYSFSRSLIVSKLVRPSMIPEGKNIPTKSAQGNPLPTIWKEAAEKDNRMVMAKITCKQSRKSFVIGTYHMPCYPQMPAMMMIHGLFAHQAIQKYADKLPCIFAGDFNIAPSSPMYTAMIDGKVPAMCPNNFLPIPLGKCNLPQTRPMKSAYFTMNGKEPDWTNNAKNKYDSQTFIDTLDYVFYSPPFQVAKVDALPTMDEGRTWGPMPLATQPSDHLMIGADLTL